MHELGTTVGVGWGWEYSRFLLELASFGDESHGGVRTCAGVGMIEPSASERHQSLDLALAGTAERKRKVWCVVC